jgi:uncharacterized membrane protein YjjB (DUF3815 family)
MVFDPPKVLWPARIALRHIGHYAVQFPVHICEVQKSLSIFKTALIQSLLSELWHSEARQ